MSKKQASILSYFRPKSVAPTPEPNSTSFSRSKPSKAKKARKCDNLDFIFLSSDTDDDDDVEVVGSNSNDLKVESNIKQCDFLAKEESNSLGGEFCDTEPFLSVTFEEGEEEMITDTIKLSADELIQSVDVDDYKWSSFRAMIDWVLQDRTNDHLFNDEDWSTVRSFTSLSVPCQQLYIRLFVRRRNWIRPSRMKYPDLGSDLQHLLDELLKSKFLSNCDSISDLKEALELLHHPEVKSLAKSLNGVTNGGGKCDSIDSIMKLCKTSISIKSHFSGKMDPLDVVALRKVKKILGSSAYSVNDDMSRLFSRMTYLYYPPQVNDDENGVIVSHELFIAQQVELGSVRYPSYTINKKEIIYKTRQELVDYDTACRLESQILVAIEKRDADVVINKFLPVAQQGFNKILTSSSKQSSEHGNLPNFLRNQTAGHVYTRCLHHIVTVLEQQKQHSIAVEILNMIIDQDVYCQHYKGRWLERLAIDYESHLKRPDDAYKAVMKALNDPNVNFAFRYTLYLRGKKLAKSSKFKRMTSIPNIPEYEFTKCQEVTIYSPTLQKSVQGRNFKKTIFTSSNATGDFSCISVEQAALNHYVSNGYAQGLHTEGTVYHALLGLFFWDIIYQDAEDAFRFKTQKLPLDFVSDRFCIERRVAIDERRKLIQEASLAELYQMMDNVWCNQMGCVSMISWDNCDLSQLKEVVCCMGNSALVAICDRLLKHFRFTRSGFPDLLVWDVSSRKIKAVEVKGPGDSLSTKQILWLEYFSTCSLPAEVCYVRAAKHV